MRIMNRKTTLPLCIALLLSVSWEQAAAFVPNAPRRAFARGVVVVGGGSHQLQNQQEHPQSLIVRYGWSPEEGVFDDEEDDYEDDDEDDNFNDIDLSDQDWRAFRAKLVMGESSYEENDALDVLQEDRPVPIGAMKIVQQVVVQDEEEDFCDPKSGECDIDGIGAVFGLKGNGTTSATTATTTTAAAAASRKSSMESSLESMTPLDPSQWAYDSGKVIEKGAVILGGVEQEYGFGLRQQYFHKAAILVLDHEESTFTKGIILNRPTDLMLDDDINPGVKWRVWFGGDVQGLNSANPDIVCLHSLKDKRVTDASVPVMKDIQWTTFDNAKRLVKTGVAEPTDFWVFCGYAGWGPNQLMGELDRKSWYMVATDSQTLLKELKRDPIGSDPRDAGLETWTLLMNMIGRGPTAEDCDGLFDDLMLKEWTLKHLLSTEAGGGAGEKQRSPQGMMNTQEIVMRKDPVDRLLSRAAAASRGEDATAGTLVRASPVDRSPFLLDDQELHKSIVLILNDDENISIGAILNRPAAKGLDIQVSQKDGSASQKSNLPIRFGGQYSVKGSEPLLWLHCSPLLRGAQVGSPIGAKDGIWKCTADDVTKAVGQGLAAPEEFIVVTGVTVWTKGEGGIARGIQGEIRKGKFEIIPDDQTHAVWDALSKQQVLTSTNLLNNLAMADEAWNAGAPEGYRTISPPEESGMMEIIRESAGDVVDMGTSEQDEKDLVFKSDVKVSQLSDKALRSWVATFLLGAPTLGA